MSLTMGHALGHRGARDGDLAVTCWCEATVVHVTPEEVFAGITRSCPRKGCRPCGKR